MNRLAVQKRALAALGIKQLACIRIADHADVGRAVLQQGDRDDREIHLPRKVHCAVNRVDHGGVCVRERVGGKILLLADKAEVGNSGGERRLDIRLHRNILRGDEVVGIAFIADREVARRHHGGSALYDVNYGLQHGNTSFPYHHSRKGAKCKSPFLRAWLDLPRRGRYNKESKLRKVRTWNRRKQLF